MRNRFGCGRLIFVGFGLLFLYWGAKLALERADLAMLGNRAEATVVRLAKKQEPKEKPFYHPVFRFTASDGKEYTVESGMGSSSPAYGVGQKLSVVHDPDDPSKAVIESFRETWVSPLVVTLFGLLLISAGLLGRTVRGKRN